MKDIITANEILTVYCKHYLSALASQQKEQLCSFKKKYLEDLIIIKDFL